MNNNARTNKRQGESLEELRKKANEADRLRAQRDRMREKLRLSEERFISLVRCAPDAVTVLDLNLVVSHVSRQTLHIHGYDAPAEMIGMHAFDLLCPDERERIEEYVQTVLREGIVRNVECTLLKKDASVFHGQISAAVIHDAAGNADAIIIHTRDLSEQKHRQDQLSESEEKFRTLAEKSPNMIFINQNGRIVYANEQCERQLGYSREELCAPAFSFLTLIAPRSVDIVKEHYARHMRGEDVPAYEYSLVARDGRRLEALNATRLITFNGKPAILGIVTDITSRKEAERALRESEQKFRGLAEEISEGVAVFTRGRIQWCNHAFAAIFGYLVEELIGCDGKALLSPESASGIHALNDIDTDGKGRPAPCETVGVRKDGAQIDIDVKAKPFTFGDRMSIQVVVRDISETKKNQRERDLIQSQLRQSQKMEAVGRLAGGLAHDFNNLLVAITGYSDLLLSRLDSQSKLRKDVQEIKKAGMRAATLTRQLLTFGRSQPIAPLSLDLKQVLVDMQGLLEKLMGENVTLEYRFSEPLLRTRADPSQIEQLVVNLAVNARDAMPSGGQLRIEADTITLTENDCSDNPDAKPGTFVRLTVSDTGVGIDTSIMQNIFEPFFTTKGPDRGTGLGLAVVYGVVKQHNGWLRITSAVQKGTTFEIYLPVHQRESLDVDAAPQTISLETFRGNGEGVLVVEDETGVREFAHKALTNHGYRVYAAATAAEALETFERDKETIQLVLSDVVLPDIQGLELATKIAAMKPETRIILSSGYMDYKTNWEEIKSRGFPFLKKPYFLADLLKSVRLAADDPIRAQ